MASTSGARFDDLRPPAINRSCGKLFARDRLKFINMLVLGSLATSGLIAPPIARWRPTKRQLDARWRDQSSRQEFFEQRQVFFEQAWSFEKALMEPKAPVVPDVVPSRADVKNDSETTNALAAFASWREEQDLEQKKKAFFQERQAFFEEAEAHSTARLKKEVNQLTSPDVPLKLVFEGNAYPATLRGNASTSALPVMATRLHNLEAKQQLRFVLNGTTPLTLGVPVAESPLANTRNLEVIILPAHSCAIRRSGIVSKDGVSCGTTWWGGAGTGSGQRRTAAARRGDAKRKQDLVQKQVLKQLAQSSGDDPEAQIVLMQHAVSRLAKSQVPSHTRHHTTSLSHTPPHPSHARRIPLTHATTPHPSHTRASLSHTQPLSHSTALPTTSHLASRAFASCFCQIAEEEKREDEEQQAQARMQLEVNRLARAAELKREADAQREQNRMQQQLESAVNSASGGVPKAQRPSQRRPASRAAVPPATGANAQQPAQEPAAAKSATARSAARKAGLCAPKSAKPPSSSPRARQQTVAVGRFESDKFSTCGFEWAQKPNAAAREMSRNAAARKVAAAESKPLVAKKPALVDPPKPSIGFDWAQGVRDP